jgi:Protein of unknown function (DUF2829)
MKDKMLTYIGTKIIHAVPMTREAVEARLKRNIGGWETGDGYLVQYEDGYESWSPKDVFDKAYRQMGLLTFGLAIEALRKGLKVARSGWNGKGMWIVYLKGYPDGIAINKNTAEATGQAEGTVCAFRPYLLLKSANGEFVPWAASQSDVLAEDWEIVA